MLDVSGIVRRLGGRLFVASFRTTSIESEDSNGRHNTEFAIPTCEAWNLDPNISRTVRRSKQK